jgi:predicted DCC family thiol-disulfide oxidoreductase YuxK
MRFAALQSDYGQAARERHPFLASVDSVVLLDQSNEGEERVFTRSDAALRVASYLGGAWKLCLAFYLIPRPVRNFFYDLVARYRYRFFGKHDACMIPAPDVRSRFLDQDQTRAL